MATNIDEEGGLIVSNSEFQSGSHDNDTDSRQSLEDMDNWDLTMSELLSRYCRYELGSRRRKLLCISKLLYVLACIAYNFYLVWLLVYLKDNRNYWFLSFIAIQPCISAVYPLVLQRNPRRFNGSAALVVVVINLMICFTMLIRLAYHHSLPDEFIGPRFIIVSLQGSIILLFLVFFFLRREFQMELLIEEKDVITRIVLDFVDIFNLAEILSPNECTGLGSFISEGSSTEMAIQAFCTMSFVILYSAFTVEGMWELGETDIPKKDAIPLAKIYVPFMSIIFQNFRFLIIRIVVWAQYKFYSLGFLVKNALAIIFCSVSIYRFLRDGPQGI